MISESQCPSWGQISGKMHPGRSPEIEVLDMHEGLGKEMIAPKTRAFSQPSSPGHEQQIITDGVWIMQD